MDGFMFLEHTHRRYNALSGEWVLVSPHRAKRPWLGQIEEPQPEKIPEYLPDCYLCPSNKRAEGVVNPDYKDTFSFINDFSALQIDIPKEKFIKDNILKAYSEKGICKVICFSPRHDLTIAQMDKKSIRKVIDLWIEEFSDLGEKKNINYIQIFENKGSIMGCSNPHPHGQIWATENIPVEPEKETKNQKKYFKKNKTTLLSNYLKIEKELNERIVVENNSFIVLVPFWAVWPYETIIISKKPHQNFINFSEEEKNDFAEIYKLITIKYDNLFKISFPYSAGIHQAPTDGKNYPEWHWHMHFYPPLLRSASIKKFMVGYEMLGNPQRDITAEQASEKLKNLPTVHYK